MDARSGTAARGGWNGSCFGDRHRARLAPGGPSGADIDPNDEMEFPMAKLTLDLDALQVETFEAAPAVQKEMPITVYPTEYRLTCC